MKDPITKKYAFAVVTVIKIAVITSFIGLLISLTFNEELTAIGGYNTYKTPGYFISGLMAISVGLLGIYYKRAFGLKFVNADGKKPQLNEIVKTQSAVISGDKSYIYNIGYILVFGWLALSNYQEFFLIIKTILETSF